MEPKTTWDLQQLTLTTDQWIKKAKEKNVNVDEEIHLIAQTIMDSPGRDPLSGELHEVTVVQQLILRGMYCSRIIRKIAEAEIRTLAQKGREDPSLRTQRALIDDCERWALAQLPSEWHLGDPGVTERLYYALSAKVKEMAAKVQSRVHSKL